jgi:hypothetical protein
VIADEQLNDFFELALCNNEHEVHIARHLSRQDLL